MSWRTAFLGGACLLACSGPTKPHWSVQRGRLPSGVAARVGRDDIALATVARIARAEHVSPGEARARALSDTLFAAQARVVFQGHALVPVLERAAWSRALLEQFKLEAAQAGPPSDAEIAALSAQRWQQFDRPETARTTHAVALTSKPADEPIARAVALRIRDAVIGVTDPAEFIRLANAVPHEGVELRAERLPALTPDGRAYYPESPPADAGQQTFDPDFAKAANGLSVGQISEPIKTRFGYHVILCDARFPMLRPSLEERRSSLQEEVLKGRAERAKQELLRHLTSTTLIPMTRAVDDLTARVRFEE